MTPCAPSRTLRALTPKQQGVLNYLLAYQLERGYPPSVREISARFGFKSTNGATEHLDALARKGFLTREAGTARAITLQPERVPAAQALLLAARAVLSAYDTSSSLRDMREPLRVLQEAVDHLSLPSPST